MATRIPSTLKAFGSRFTLNRMALYSSSAVAMGAGFYKYHSPVPTNTSEVNSYSSKQLFHDYASSANTNKAFQRITIPSGKASVVNYNPIHEQKDFHHILITVQGEGEVHYTPQNEHIINGIRTHSVIKQELKLGNSVGIPSTEWHQIINKHKHKDLVLVVTSIPAQN